MPIEKLVTGMVGLRGPRGAVTGTPSFLPFQSQSARSSAQTIWESGPDSRSALSDPARGAPPQPMRRPSAFAGRPPRPFRGSGPSACWGPPRPSIWFALGLEREEAVRLGVRGAPRDGPGVPELQLERRERELRRTGLLSFGATGAATERDGARAARGTTRGGHGGSWWGSGSGATIRTAMTRMRTLLAALLAAALPLLAQQPAVVTGDVEPPCSGPTRPRPSRTRSSSAKASRCSGRVRGGCS